MTYEEVVHCVRDAYENADAREIYEHIAVQVNVTGEGEGAFYIEVAGRAVCVEPYDYYDRDGLLTASSETIADIAKGTLTFREAIDKGLLKVEGNMDKLTKLAKIKPEVPHKKRAAKAEPKSAVKAETKAVVMVIPADGPSLGIAPSGTCKCTADVSIFFLSIPNSLAWALM